jgi:hypothetical protein
MMCGSVQVPLCLQAFASIKESSSVPVPLLPKICLPTQSLSVCLLE